MHDSRILITKADGRQVPFAETQLTRSLERIGANEELIQQVLSQVQDQLRPGMKSSEIYRLAYQQLRKKARPLAARYKLRRAVLELGPTGYPFEAYIGEIFRHLGYQTQVGVTLSGHCVTHEVDVLAERSGQRISVECKFGNQRHKKVDVKVALYIHSRFRDLVKAWRSEPGWEKGQFEGWIVTNGEFTEDALSYGRCAGLHLVSWRYPQRGNLKELIEHSQLYPVTSLASITKADKNRLLKQGLVLVKSLRNRPDLLETAMVPPNRVQRCLEEVEGLCGE